MPAFCYPDFLVYGQNHIRIFLYMDRMLEFVHIWEKKDTILFIYGKIRMREPVFWRSAMQRFSYRTFNQNLNIARYKEVSVINKLHYSEVLPCDEFICNNFPLIGFVCVILIETRPCLTFVFR